MGIFPYWAVTLFSNRRFRLGVGEWGRGGVEEWGSGGVGEWRGINIAKWLTT